MLIKTKSSALVIVSAIYVLAANGSLAEAIGAREVQAGAWRALFAKPDYNQPCPLTVYSEDLSQPAGRVSRASAREFEAARQPARPDPDGADLSHLEKR